MPNPLAWPITVITGQSLPKGSQQKYGTLRNRTETAMHTVVCFQSFPDSPQITMCNPSKPPSEPLARPAHGMGLMITEPSTWKGRG